MRPTTAGQQCGVGRQRVAGDHHCDRREQRICSALGSGNPLVDAAGDAERVLLRLGRLGEHPLEPRRIDRCFGSDPTALGSHQGVEHHNRWHVARGCFPDLRHGRSAGAARAPLPGDSDLRPESAPPRPAGPRDTAPKRSSGSSRRRIPESRGRTLPRQTGAEIVLRVGTDAHCGRGSRGQCCRELNSLPEIVAAGACCRPICCGGGRRP